MAVLCRLIGHNWQRVGQPLDGGQPYSLCHRCGDRRGIDDEAESVPNEFVKR